MLAPANHGSALAQLGKSKLSRLKAYVTEGVEPGTGVLNWLELGSTGSWELNRAWLDYDYAQGRFFPVVLTGQSIDRNFYDNLNSYTGEAGSDGVVRVAAANLNYGLLSLRQEGAQLVLAETCQSPASACGVLSGLAHSGDDMGIMRSVKKTDDGSHPTVQWILRTLAVKTAAQYRKLTTDLAALTAQTQMAERSETVRNRFLFKRTFHTSRYCMLVIRLTDDRANLLRDYEVIFTAGPDYDPNHLPPGFFVDRQRNQINPGKLTYYVDYDVMAEWFAQPEVDDCFGIRVVARPRTGYAYYEVAEFKGKFSAIQALIGVNETLMMDIRLNRRVRTGVFQLTADLKPKSFAKQPHGEDLPDNI